MPNDHHRPVTKAEHRAAYEEHRARATRLFQRLVADGDALRVGGPIHHRHQVAEYHDELAAMSWHYTAAMLAEELGE